jgi:small subunit ribosomal protein S8
MISDPIGDMLTRIRNAYMAGRKSTSVPYSRIKQQIAALLVDEKYLAEVETVGEKVQEKQIKLTLRYEQKEPTVTHIKRISKPGIRIYKSAKQLERPLSGLGTAVLSTSQGIMTLTKAKQVGIGGELLFEIW